MSTKRPIPASIGRRLSRLTASQELEAAITELAAFTWRRTREITSRVGFGWRPSRYAPSTFEDLGREYRLCRLGLVPLRVSSRHNETAILGPVTNLAFRFWHDSTHIRVDRGFDHEGEIEVSQQQLAELEAVGVRQRSITWRLLFAETVGQTECMHRLQTFPEDQTRFSLDYLSRGLDAAIELESEQRATVRRRGLRVISGGRRDRVSTSVSGDAA